MSNIRAIDVQRMGGRAFGDCSERVRRTLQRSLSAAQVFHSFANLNPNHADQVLSGVTPDGHQLTIGFEDLPRATGDNDFQDVVVTIHVTPDDNRIM